MTVDEAFELLQPLMSQVATANRAFRTMPNAPDDLEEFYEFYDEAEQRSVVERAHKAVAALLAGWAQLKGPADNEKLYVRELRRPTQQLCASLKAADATFDSAAIDAVLAGVTLPATSRAIAAPPATAPGTEQAVLALLGFLARTDDERTLLGQIAANALTITERAGSVEITFSSSVLVCDAPGKSAANLPASYAAIASVFSRIVWKHGGASMGYVGSTASSWEWQALDEGDNATLLAALTQAKLQPSDIRCAFACGSNWILFDPTHNAKNGEPALAFVSHGDCKWVPMRSADEHDASAVLLHLMAWSLAGKRPTYQEIFA